MLVFASNWPEQNNVSLAKIAQSTELSQHVKQSVLATLKIDEIVYEIVFWTPRFSFLYSTLFCLDSTFWLDSTLKLYYALSLS